MPLSVSSEREVAELVERHIARVREDGANAGKHGSLGLVYEANSFWEEAAESFARAAQLEPENSGWKYHRAIVLGELGDSAGSLELLREAARGETSDPAVHCRLGTQLVRDGELREAIEAFNTSLGIDPDQPHPKVGLARVAVENGDYQDARELLEPIVLDHPQYGHAHFVLGRAYLGLELEEEAQRELALGLDSQPQVMSDRYTAELDGYRLNFNDQMALGVTRLQENNLDEGIAIFERLRGRRPDDERVLNNLAVGYTRKQDYARAEELLLELIARSPDQFASYINLATCSRHLGKLEASLEYAEKAVELAPDNARSHFSVAETLMALERVSETLPVLERVVRIDPAFINGQRSLGAIHMRMGDFSSAITPLKASVGLEPRDLMAITGLIESLIRLRRFNEAKPYLDMAVSLSPRHPRVVAMRHMFDNAPR